MHPSVAYRTLSAVQAVLYGLLVTSILIRPPKPIADKPTMFELVATNVWWASAFGLIAAALLTAAVLLPDRLSQAHALLLPILFGYGFANFGTSLLNGTGWQVGSLALALAAGHGHAVLPRADTGRRERP
jgi:hypothetical protein